MTAPDNSLSECDQTPDHTTKVDWLEFAVVMAIGVVPHVVSSVGYSFEHGMLPLRADWDAWTANASMLCSALGRQVGVLFLLLFVLARRGRGLREIGLAFRYTDVPHALALIAVSLIGAIFVVKPLVCLFFPNWKEWVITGGAVQSRSVISSILLFAYILLTPFCEDCVQVGYFMERLKAARLGRGAVVLLCAAVRLSCHTYQGWFQVVVMAPFFLGYALYFSITNRLWPIIAIHFLVNLTHYLVV